MIQEAAFKSLAAFLPRLALERLARAGNATRCPTVETFPGVLLWTDVTGFTPLVERLSAQGNVGTERLSEALGSHFGRLIELVEDAGGDLLFLAGDGALSLWRVNETEPLARVARRALAAAQAILNELDGDRPQPDILLRLRGTLAAGPLAAFTVGGQDEGQWLDLVTGSTVHDLGIAAARGQPGALALTDEFARLLVGPFRDGSPRESPPRSTAPSLTAPGTAEAVSTGRTTWVVGDPSTLAPYVLPSVASRIGGGHSDFLAEFRTITIAFVDLSALGDACALDRLQEVVAAVQSTAGAYEGTVYQLVQDDKGTSAIAVFGLPGCSHEDDPARAVRFARKLSERLHPLLGKASCGISTGPVFCGPCGLPHRCQYALFGRAMNRAARLMAAAAGNILLDEATYHDASRRLALGSLRRLSLKGLDEPLAAYPGDLAPASAAATPRLVGRREERNLLAQKIDQLLAHGAPEVVTIEGPPGIGKTSLLNELRRLCEARRCALAWGSADFRENRTPFFALRTVFREMLGLDSVSTSVGTPDQLASTLRAVGESVDLIPLLSQVLGDPIADNPFTTQMTPTIRAENRIRLLLALSELASARCWVVVVDDLHWADAATCALLPRLVAQPGFLWVLACRTEEPATEVLAQLPRDTTRLKLNGLGTPEIAAIAASTLGTSAVPPALAALLVDRAEGNPLYSRELTRALRETGCIQVHAAQNQDAPACSLAPDFNPARPLDLPSSLSALIKSRLDRLPPAAQITLRVASVIGQLFERGVLTEMITSAPRAQVEESLAVLAAEGFLRDAGGAGEGRFAFDHAAIHAVAYGLFPDRQRAQLHRAAAMALEKIYGSHAPDIFGRLSHHWNEGNNPEKATRYSAVAAQQALEHYANSDAIDLFRRALHNQAVWRGRRAIDVERATFYEGLGQAHYSLTQPREARAAFAAALQQVGLRDPGAGVGVATGMVRYFLNKALSRTDDQRVPQTTSDEQERLLAALSILGEWMPLDFWEGRLTEGAAKAFLGHRLARPVLESPLGAEAVARLGYVLAVTPFRAFAETELLHAVELAVRSGDLQAIASSRVFLGMYYTLDGRAEQALRPLEEAQRPAEKLGGGLWRHRTRFMLGEALLCLGRFEEARAAFGRAAELSIGAEPPVVGLSICMAALAVARLGDFAEALALLDGPMGLPLIEGTFLPLQRFASLGVKAEVLTRLGRVDEALAIAREAGSLVHGKDCDVFFAGLHGHAGSVEARLGFVELARAAGAHAEATTVAAEGLRACRQLQRFARMYPAARPRAQLIWGRWLLAAGQPRAARAALRRSVAGATRMKLPYELALAHYWTAQVDDGRANHLDQAEALCRTFRMRHEAELSRAAATRRKES